MTDTTASEPQQDDVTVLRAEVARLTALLDDKTSADHTGHLVRGYYHGCRACLEAFAAMAVEVTLQEVRPQLDELRRCRVTLGSVLSVLAEGGLINLAGLERPCEPDATPDHGVHPDHTTGAGVLAAIIANPEPAP